MPFEGRCACAPTEDLTGELALDAVPIPTSALCGSQAENESQADRHPSSVLG
jgi:hypothetical protein